MLIPRPHLGGERGFTLIEVIVAMVSGVLVIGAAFAVLEVSMHQTQRITGRVQANQLGRQTMTTLIDELHSACIAKEFAPVLAKSTTTKLLFISGVGEEAVLKTAYLHEILFEEKTKQQGTLVDKTYEPSGGSWPSFKFESPKLVSTRRIGEYLSQAGATPVFQYYQYASASSSSTTSALSTLNPTPLVATGEGLTEAEAKKAASVAVTFDAGAPEGLVQYKPSVEESDQVSLSFSVPSAETPVVAKPCE